jgi:hypothetical protein
MPPLRAEHRAECCAGLPGALQRGRGRRRLGRRCRRGLPKPSAGPIVASAATRHGTRRRPLSRPGLCSRPLKPSGGVSKLAWGRRINANLRASPAAVIAMSRSSTRHRAPPPAPGLHIRGVADGCHPRREVRSPPPDSKRSLARLRRRRRSRAPHAPPLNRRNHPRDALRPRFVRCAEGRSRVAVHGETHGRRFVHPGRRRSPPRRRRFRTAWGCSVMHAASESRRPRSSRCVPTAGSSRG